MYNIQYGKYEKYLKYIIIGFIIINNNDYMPNMYKTDFFGTKSCTWLCVLELSVHKGASLSSSSSSLAALPGVDLRRGGAACGGEGRGRRR